MAVLPKPFVHEELYSPVAGFVISVIQALLPTELERVNVYIVISLFS